MIFILSSSLKHFYQFDHDSPNFKNQLEILTQSRHVLSGNKTRNFCVIYKILDKKESSIYHVIVPLEVTEFTHLTIDNDPGAHLHIFINYSNML